MPTLTDASLDARYTLTEYRPAMPLIAYATAVTTIAQLVAQKVPAGGPFLVSAAFSGTTGDAFYDAGATPGAVGYYLDPDLGTTVSFRSPHPFEVVFVQQEQQLYWYYQTPGTITYSWVKYYSLPQRALGAMGAFDVFDPDGIYNYYAQLLGGIYAQLVYDGQVLAAVRDHRTLPTLYVSAAIANIGAGSADNIANPDSTADQQRVASRATLEASPAFNRRLGQPSSVINRIQVLGYEGQVVERWTKITRPMTWLHAVSPGTAANVVITGSGRPGVWGMQQGRGRQTAGPVWGDGATQAFGCIYQPDQSIADGDWVRVGDGSRYLTFYFKDTPTGPTDVQVDVVDSTTIDNFIAVFNASGLDIVAFSNTSVAWVANTAYTVGQVVANLGDLYACLVTGTSAPLPSTGPALHSPAFYDGSVVWSYIGSYEFSSIFGDQFPVYPHGYDSTRLGPYWPTKYVNIFLNNADGSEWLAPWYWSRAYVLGQYVVSGPTYFRCTLAGVAAAAGVGPVVDPTDPLAPVVDNTAEWTYAGVSVAPADWLPVSSYVVGQYSQNRGNYYVCRTLGTSAASVGPTGTLDDIVDGTVHWAYVSLATSPERSRVRDAVTTSLYQSVLPVSALISAVGTSQFFGLSSAGTVFIPTYTARTDPVEPEPLCGGRMTITNMTSMAVVYDDYTGPGYWHDDLALPSTVTPTAWVALTLYTVGSYVTNGGLYYRCTVGGLSASAGGPSGTLSTIADGTVIWSYAGSPL